MTKIGHDETVTINREIIANHLNVSIFTHILSSSIKMANKTSKLEITNRGLYDYIMEKITSHRLGESPNNVKRLVFSPDGVLCEFHTTADGNMPAPLTIHFSASDYYKISKEPKYVPMIKVLYGDYSSSSRKMQNIEEILFICPSETKVKDADDGYIRTVELVETELAVSRDFFKTSTNREGFKRLHGIGIATSDITFNKFMEKWVYSGECKTDFKLLTEEIKKWGVSYELLDGVSADDMFFTKKTKDGRDKKPFYGIERKTYKFDTHLVEYFEKRIEKADKNSPYKEKTKRELLDEKNKEKAEKTIAELKDTFLTCYEKYVTSLKKTGFLFKKLNEEPVCSLFYEKGSIEENTIPRLHLCEMIKTSDFTQIMKWKAFTGNTPDSASETDRINANIKILYKETLALYCKLYKSLLLKGANTVGKKLTWAIIFKQIAPYTIEEVLATNDEVNVLFTQMKTNLGNIKIDGSSFNEEVHSTNTLSPTATKSNITKISENILQIKDIVTDTFIYTDEP